jgi:hypothetical protein
MEVERAERQVQDRRRNELSVVGQDREVRFERQDRLDRFSIAQPLRREDGLDAYATLGFLAERRRAQLQFSPGRPWRSRDDADELDVVRRVEVPQRVDAE